MQVSMRRRKGSRAGPGGYNPNRLTTKATLTQKPLLGLRHGISVGQWTKVSSTTWSRLRSLNGYDKEPTWSLRLQRNPGAGPRKYSSQRHPHLGDFSHPTSRHLGVPHDPKPLNFLAKKDDDLAGRLALEPQLDFLSPLYLSSLPSSSSKSQPLHFGKQRHIVESTQYACKERPALNSCTWT